MQRRVALVVSGLFGCITPAAALDVSTAYSVGAQYSDNIGLVPENEEEAWVGLATARIGLRERAANVDLDVLGLFEYRDYQTDLFDDEFLVSLDARAVWTLDPGRRYWHFEDYYRQADSDPLEPPTPENREDTNILSTGPEFQWRLSPYRTVIAGARYGYFWFEEEDIDSQRLSAYARLVHDWRARTRLSVNGEVTNVGYIEERHPDYNRGDLFLRVEHTLARGILQADAGVTLIRREEGDDLDGFLGRLGWTLNLNSYSSVEAAVLYEYTDAGHDILETAGRDGGVGILDEQVSGDLYYNRHAELAYDWHGVRTSLRVAGILREEDHESEGLDRTIGQIHGFFGYHLSATLRLALTGSYSEEDFREVDRVLRDRHAGLALHYQLNSRLWTALEVGTTKRESDDPTAEYTENVGLIRLTYERTPPFLE